MELLLPFLWRWSWVLSIWLRGVDFFFGGLKIDSVSFWFGLACIGLDVMSYSTESSHHASFIDALSPSSFREACILVPFVASVGLGCYHDCCCNEASPHPLNWMASIYSANPQTDAWALARNEDSSSRAGGNGTRRRSRLQQRCSRRLLQQLISELLSLSLKNSTTTSRRNSGWCSRLCSVR